MTLSYDVFPVSDALQTRVYRLPSGMRLALTPMKHTAAVSLDLHVAAGARHEDASSTGVAHFLEHMAFKGTETRDAKRIAEEFDGVGASSNAATGREFTSYYSKCLAEYAPVTLELLADIFLRSTFSEEETEKERGVILQEIYMTRDMPEEMVFDLFQEACYGDTPMGRPILGPEEAVRAYTREDLLRFRNSRYTPGRTVLGVAGNFNPDAMAEACAAAFEDFKGFSDASAPSAPQAEPAIFQGGYRAFSRDLDQAHIVFGVNSAYHGRPDYRAAQLLGLILGGGMSSRLFQEVREKRGLAYGVGASLQGYEDTGALSIYGSCSPENLAPMTDVILEERRKIAEGVTEKELATAKNRLRASVLMNLEKCNFASSYTASKLALRGSFLSVEEIMAQINAVKSDDVAACAARYLSDSEGRPFAAACAGPEESTAAAALFKL